MGSAEKVWILSSTVSSRDPQVNIKNCKWAIVFQKVFSSLQTYQTYIQEAFKVFKWLSMTFLAPFLKTETLVMENYCPIDMTWRRLILLNVSKKWPKKSISKHKGCRQMVIEPVHCNSGSILKVRFFLGHPVYIL